MKIIIDETLTTKEDWFELLEVSVAKGKTAFKSPDHVKTLIKDGEKTVILTIPSSLSGQYNAYQVLENENVIVVEGTAFFSRKEDVRKTIYDSKFDRIKQKIQRLNNEIEYKGIILDTRKVPLAGRINQAGQVILKSMRLKVLLGFKDNKWVKEEVSLNGFKLFKKAIGDLKSATIVISDKLSEKVKGYIERLDKDVKISIQKQTRIMNLHSGDGFIAIYATIPRF